MMTSNNIGISTNLFDNRRDISPLKVEVKNIACIDEYLGDASSRFFGEGYKKIKYKMGSKNISEKKAEVMVSIQYPEHWSIKRKKNKLKPHLSSIDTVIIATNLCGSMLANQLGHVNGCFVNSITVIAGKAPLLALDGVLALMQLATKSIEGNIELFNFTGNVGQMQVEIEVMYDSLQSEKIADCLLANDYIEGNFTKSKQEIKNISIHADKYAEASFIKNSSLTAYHSVDIIDAFVASLQLGQVLLYELDSITRSISNNLWMRTIRITKKEAETQHSKKILTVLDDLHLLRICDDDWRSANIVSNVHGINVICSVAHQLPGEGRNNVH